MVPQRPSGQCILCHLLKSLRLTQKINQKLREALEAESAILLGNAVALAAEADPAAGVDSASFTAAQQLLAQLREADQLKLREAMDQCDENENEKDQPVRDAAPAGSPIPVERLAAMEHLEKAIAEVEASGTLLLAPSPTGTSSAQTSQEDPLLVEARAKLSSLQQGYESVIRARLRSAVEQKEDAVEIRDALAEGEPVLERSDPDMQSAVRALR